LRRISAEKWKRQEERGRTAVVFPVDRLEGKEDVDVAAVELTTTVRTHAVELDVRVDLESCEGDGEGEGQLENGGERTGEERMRGERSGGEETADSVEGEKRGGREETRGKGIAPCSLMMSKSAVTSSRGMLCK
jgi:hypothetical protein